jgi:membrane fusion protein, multidrug efflux system
MAKRMIFMLVLMAALIAALAVIKMRQFQAMAAQFAAMQPPPEAVTTIVAARADWPATISAIGTVAAVQGVTVSADLPASSIGLPSTPAGR